MKTILRVIMLMWVGMSFSMVYTHTYGQPDLFFCMVFLWFGINGVILLVNSFEGDK